MRTQNILLAIFMIFMMAQGVFGAVLHTRRNHHEKTLPTIENRPTLEKLLDLLLAVVDQPVADELSRQIRGRQSDLECLLKGKCPES